MFLNFFIRFTAILSEITHLPIVCVLNGTKKIVCDVFVQADMWLCAMCSALCYEYVLCSFDLGQMVNSAKSTLDGSKCI